MGLKFIWRRITQKSRKEDRKYFEIVSTDNGKPKTQLYLGRNVYTDKSTIGDLKLLGEFFCNILEDPVREIKIPKITAIPEGTYEVVITYSNRFKKFMPLLLNVPNYIGIRIHAGARPEHTEGCLLTGTKTNKPDEVGDQFRQYDRLFARLKQMCKKEKVYIEIKNEGR